ncbi:hypothetical protein GCM10023223_07890 [Stackebrandtia albiflava]
MASQNIRHSSAPSQGRNRHHPVWSQSISLVQCSSLYDIAVLLTAPARTSHQVDPEPQARAHTQLELFGSSADGGRAAWWSGIARRGVGAPCRRAVPERRRGAGPADPPGP